MSDVLHAGFSRYHGLSLVVPLVAALSPMAFARMNIDVSRHHAALLYGFTASVGCYVLFKMLLEPDSYPKALLLGLLVAEFTLFGASPKTPSIVNILLFLFVYFFGLSHMEH